MLDSSFRPTLAMITRHCKIEIIDLHIYELSYTIVQVIVDNNSDGRSRLAGLCVEI